MVLHRDPDASLPIRWQCSVCDDEGVINNWADSPFDLRPRSLIGAEPVHEIAIPADVATALRELQLLDTDCERLVFRIRPHGNGAILPTTEEGLEELIGYVAAEANHAPNQRRRRRLDAAFDTLNDAAHPTRGW